MLRTYLVPFEVGPGKVIYKIRVTDRRESRDVWKRAEAIKQACAQFAEDYSGNGHRHVIVEDVREI